jgi:hypothetical protein
MVVELAVELLGWALAAVVAVPTAAVVEPIGLAVLAPAPLLAVAAVALALTLDKLVVCVPLAAPAEVLM